jgi:hypothetical protein
MDARLDPAKEAGLSEAAKFRQWVPIRVKDGGDGSDLMLLSDGPELIETPAETFGALARAGCGGKTRMTVKPSSTVQPNS